MRNLQFILGLQLHRIDSSVHGNLDSFLLFMTNVQTGKRPEQRFPRNEVRRLEDSQSVTLESPSGTKNIVTCGVAPARSNRRRTQHWAATLKPLPLLAECMVAVHCAGFAWSESGDSAGVPCAGSRCGPRPAEPLA